MALPKQTDQWISRPTEDRSRSKHDVYARAPYNFVPLPEKVVTVGDLPDHDRYYANRHTGWVECELETKTPLYVRGMLTEPAFAEVGDKPFYDKDGLVTDAHREERAKFFMIEDGKPVIPGTSLRGMIRTIVEIAGFGKVQLVDGNPPVYRAVGEQTDSSLARRYREQFKQNRECAGYMEQLADNSWAIRPAQTIAKGYEFAVTKRARPARATKWVKTRNCALVSATNGREDKFGDWRFEDVSAGQDFVFVETGKGIGKTGKNKNNYVFGLPDDSATLLQLDDQLVSRYRDQFTQGQEALLGSHGVLLHRQPVFYLVDSAGRVIFFGHTRYFRLPYDHSPRDFVPVVLRDEQKVDLAEAIFGYVKSDKVPAGKQRAYAGRIFVCDAYMLPNQPDWRWKDGEMKWPQILSGSKPTTFQHYLVQADAKDKRALKHYASRTPDETVIRGHKLYWHRKGTRWEFEGDQKDRDDVQTQLTGIKPVREGITFAFRMYFENLNDVELGALLWLLDLPEGHYHKLGMGKPLGLGSVRVNVNALHITERTSRYASLFDGDAWNAGTAIERPAADFRAEFEQYVLDRMDQGERNNARALADLPRIKELMAMLDFQNAPPEGETRYMEIERTRAGADKLNEYKNRPVLPLPSVVARPHQPNAEMPTTTSQHTRQPTSPTQAEQSHKTEGPGQLVREDQSQTKKARVKLVARLKRGNQGKAQIEFEGKRIECKDFASHMEADAGKSCWVEVRFSKDGKPVSATFLDWD